MDPRRARAGSRSRARPAERRKRAAGVADRIPWPRRGEFCVMCMNPVCIQGPHFRLRPNWEDISGIMSGIRGHPGRVNGLTGGCSANSSMSWHRGVPASFRSGPITSLHQAPRFRGHELPSKNKPMTGPFEPSRNIQYCAEGTCVNYTCVTFLRAVSVGGTAPFDR